MKKFLLSSLSLLDSSKNADKSQVVADGGFEASQHNHWLNGLANTT